MSGDMENTNDSKKDLLEKYASRKPPYPALVKPDQEDLPEDPHTGDYRGLIEHRGKRGNTPRFRIIDRKGNSYGCGYAYLLGWYFTPPDTLTIYTTTHVFTLNGDHLQRVEDSLMREKIESLCAFNPSRDKKPEAGEVCITQLLVIDRMAMQDPGGNGEE